MNEIRAGLSAREAHEQLLTALAELRRAERSALLCFAEIQERKLYRELGYSTIHVYASEALGFSRSKTFEFIRLAEKLKKLPKLKRSVESGEIPWTKAREVAKVATSRSERRWIREAKNCGRRELERKVRESRACAKAAAKSDRRQISLLDPAPASLEERSVDIPCPLTLNFSAEQRARFEAIVERLRRTAGRSSTGSMTREDLILEALALLLAGEGPGRGKGNASSADSLPEEGGCGSEPGGGPDRGPERVHPGGLASPYQIIVYRCEKCGRASVQSPEGLQPLSAVEQARIECDARVLAPGERNRATIPPAMRREVLARDRHRCRVKGCGRAQFLEAHHLVPRSAGGKNNPENLVTLCSSCHRLLHERGLAEGVLEGLLRAGP